MKYLLPAAALLLSLGACNNTPQFHVEGSLSGKPAGAVILERNDPQVGWIAVDSVTPGADGTFTLSYEAPSAPEMFRLSNAGHYVYLPVDSVETLTLSAPAGDISRGFTLTGSRQADQLTAFERDATRIEALANADSTAAFRRAVYDTYLRPSHGDILSYYILSRRMGDGYLIEYTDPLYWAVATSFQTYRPDDPHTKALVERAAQGQKEARKGAGRGQVVQATQTAMIDIELPGTDGKKHKLSSQLCKGKPVLLVFYGMTYKDSPELNRRLNQLYTSGRADIYQVCLDADQYAWAQAAKALPWRVVYDPDGLQSRAAASYNLASVPAFFIYNVAGELTASAPDLASAVTHLGQ